MEKQYCKVGAVTPLSEEKRTLFILENLYHNFISKANLEHADSKLKDFFEQKAAKIKKSLLALGVTL